VKLPRDLSGRTLVAVLVRDWGYRQVNQVSHIILQTDAPVHHRLAIPDHSRLRVGTLTRSRARTSSRHCSALSPI
jgi:hypothetical protein